MNRSKQTRELLALKQQHAYRQRKILQSPQGVNVTIDGKSFSSFCSNDYLGLANDPRVRTASCQAINKFGVGSGASQLITGYSMLHAKLESALAKFLNYERVLLFSSGYLANLAVVSTFATRDSLILQDRLNHASLLDAARYAGTKLQRYRHRDSDHLVQLLAKKDQQEVLLATDGVFSMEGTVAPLAELVAINKSHHSMLVVDDAHGIGVIGSQGKGSLEYCNIKPNNVDILVGTFGKAFGSSGAFVATSNDNAEYLIQKARTLIYTTAPPSALAAAAHTSLDIIIEESQRRERLHRNINYFRQRLSSSKLDLQESITPIQTILIGKNYPTLQFSEQLSQRGILILAIRPPTVPENTARLRITLCSEHSYQQIDALVSALLDIEQTQRHSL